MTTRPPTYFYLTNLFSLSSVDIAYKLLNDCYEVKDDSITFDFKYIEDPVDTSNENDSDPEESSEDPTQNAEEGQSVSVEQP